jgi:hypothetical protein
MKRGSAAGARVSIGRVLLRGTGVVKWPVTPVPIARVAERCTVSRVIAARQLLADAATLVPKPALDVPPPITPFCSFRLIVLASEQ